MYLRKMLLVMLFAAILLSGCIETDQQDNGSGDNGSNEPPQITSEMEKEIEKSGINVTDTKALGSNVTIEYEQPANAKPEEIYANWSYIFGTALNNAPNQDQIETLTILCNFSDGEKMKITATVETVKAFFDEEIDTWDFLYALDIEALTKGPEISTN